MELIKKNQVLRLEDTDCSDILVVVVDLQNDFCARESVYRCNRSNNRAVARRVYGFVETMREIGIKTVFFRQIYDRRKLTSRQRRYYIRNSPSCKAGTEGAEYFEYNPPADSLFTKYNYDLWQNKEFEDYLDREGINTLVFTGVDILCCILHAVLGAVERGFTVVLPEDLVSTFDEWAPEAKQLLSILAKLYLPVVSSNALIKELKRLQGE